MTIVDASNLTDPVNYRTYWRNVEQDIIVGAKYVVVGAIFIAVISAIPLVTAASVVSGAILGVELKGFISFADSLWDSKEIKTRLCASLSLLATSLFMPSVAIVIIGSRIGSIISYPKSREAIYNLFSL
ncbi:hypothetical protein [Undibacterium sp.]|uniref:hypothetical protein n=1 Tax=Undibacterium sp. TaxID=1914977 RepID=UPI00273075DF|nr:hypothetical protein [Undibacterium sp.]MDP1978683.1 hypothetical protein [Undibacterium sp.]